MHSRLMIAALTAAIAAVPTAAEPTKPAAEQVAQPANRTDIRAAEVLLASSEIRTPGQQSDGQVAASPPAKRPRAARVTSCRCGDQTAPQKP